MMAIWWQYHGNCYLKVVKSRTMGLKRLLTSDSHQGGAAGASDVELVGLVEVVSVAGAVVVTEPSTSRKCHR